MCVYLCVSVCVLCAQNQMPACAGTGVPPQPVWVGTRGGGGARASILI